MRGDKLKTGYTKEYYDNYDKVFSKEKKPISEFDKFLKKYHKEVKPYDVMLLRSLWEYKEKEIEVLVEALKLCYDYVRGKKTDVPLVSTLKKVLKDKV